MTYGPLQLVVIGLDGPDIPSDVVQTLGDLRDEGIVRLVDVAFVVKDNGGDLDHLPASSDLSANARLAGLLTSVLFGDPPTFHARASEVEEFDSLAAEHATFGITDRDVEEIADLIPPGATVALILIEHLWAARLKESVRQSGCAILAHGWITPSTLLTIR